MSAARFRLDILHHYNRKVCNKLEIIHGGVFEVTISGFACITLGGCKKESLKKGDRSDQIPTIFERHTT
jgi:hypothetical protein